MNFKEIFVGKVTTVVDEKERESPCVTRRLKEHNEWLRHINASATDLCVSKIDNILLSVFGGSALGKASVPHGGLTRPRFLVI